MPDAYDVVVVGAGHNGLVAATYLARAGRRVLVLEARPVLGGAAATESFHPGFRGLPGAALCGGLRPEIVRDLDLARHGLQMLPVDPQVVALGEDGTSVRFWRDPTRTYAELAATSPDDAVGYARLRSFLLSVAEVLDPLLVRPPPDVGALGISDQLALLRRALGLRRLGRDTMNQAMRMATMSLQLALKEWLTSDLVKASLAVDALLGTFRGPWSPGTAFLLLHPISPAVHGGAWDFVRGGTGALADALASAAREAGVAIRTQAEVVRILTQDGRATGVELASGERIPANAVLSNADPKRTFLRLVDPAELELSFLHAVRSIQMDGAVARVHLALEKAPRFPATPDGGLVPRFRIAPSLEYIERAYDDAKYGSPSKEPFLDVVVPTVLDPSLAPPDKHVMSVLVQYAPYRLKQGGWDEQREKLGDLVVDMLERYLPGVRQSILGREVLTPLDLERRFGLTGGHIYHGEMTLNQQFVLRPVPGWARYRTPIEGLYLCGSGAHPGGGITGAPGYACAQAVLRA